MISKHITTRSRQVHNISATYPRIVFYLFLFIFLLHLPSCKNHKTLPTDKNAEIQDITRAIHATIGWAANKDTALLYSVIATDSSFREVHPNNHVVYGIDEFRKAEAFWLNPDFKAVRYEISDLRINLSQSGTVAWFCCLLDDINEWKGQPASWENTRWTGVLEKRDGNWRMVQQHFSIASE